MTSEYPRLTDEERECISEFGGDILAAALDSAREELDKAIDGHEELERQYQDKVAELSDALASLATVTAERDGARGEIEDVRRVLVPDATIEHDGTPQQEMWAQGYRDGKAALSEKIAALLPHPAAPGECGDRVDRGAEIWDVIDAYVRACGGHADACGVYPDMRRQQMRAHVTRTVLDIERDARALTAPVTVIEEGEILDSDGSFICAVDPHPSPASPTCMRCKELEKALRVIVDNVFEPGNQPSSLSLVPKDAVESGRALLALTAPAAGDEGEVCTETDSDDCLKDCPAMGMDTCGHAAQPAEPEKRCGECGLWVDGAPMTGNPAYLLRACSGTGHTNRLHPCDRRPEYRPRPAQPTAAGDRAAGEEENNTDMAMELRELYTTPAPQEPPTGTCSRCGAPLEQFPNSDVWYCSVGCSGMKALSAAQPTDDGGGRTCGIGDYVLATKYEDGDPCDHFVVGFVSGRLGDDRWMVKDGAGNNFRANGFRRVEVITEGEGHALVALFQGVSDKPGPSLWEHLDRIRPAKTGGESDDG